MLPKVSALLSVAARVEMAVPVAAAVAVRPTITGGMMSIRLLLRYGQKKKAISPAKEAKAVPELLDIRDAS